MLAVSRGECPDHQGWQCGPVEEYGDGEDADATATADASEEAASNESAAPDANSPATEPEAPAAPPMNKMLINLMATTAAVQLMKRFKDAPWLLLAIRLAYYVSVGARLLVHGLIGWRIGVAADSRLLSSASGDPMADPLSSLLGGLGAALGGGGDEKKQTVADYDRAQLRSVQSSFQMGAIVTFLLHLKFKWNQTLVYSAVSSLVDVFFHPLFQIHLLNRPAVGALKRPFGSGGPDMAGMMKAMAARSAAAAPS